MGKFRLRLVMALLTLILLVLTGLGLTIGQLLKGYYFEQLTDRLHKEAELSSYLVIDDLNNLTKIQELTVHISEMLGARVTIMDDKGTVIGESYKKPDFLENHINRPEIVQAIETESAYEIRYSNTVQAELLYYVITLKSTTGEKLGFLRLGIPTEELRRMNQKIWGILIFGLVIAFGIITSFIYRITNQMVRPIEDATRVANALAEGNYKIRTAEGYKDEVGQLSRSINVLAFNLDRITKRHEIQQGRMKTLIENMGSGLILINTRGDITLINKTCKDIFQEDTELWLNKLYHEVIKHREVIRFIQDIFMTEKPQRRHVKMPINIEIRHFDVHGAPILSNNDKLKGIALVFHDITELKKLEQARKDFVANVSHELKTPVTSIRGFSETLLDGAMDDKALREKFLTIIFKESERLQSLIQDLLELSKIEQHHFELNWQIINLQEVIEDVIELLKDNANEKELTITTECHGNTFFKADILRMKQIVINLINNALMYTPSKGIVHVKVVELDNHIELQIMDTGIGISEEELPRIFERFYRVDRARSRNSGGTGLGLAIVKHLVEAHHGNIKVRSRVGKGTTFTLTFPKEYKKEV